MLCNRQRLLLEQKTSYTLKAPTKRLASKRGCCQQQTRTIANSSSEAASNSGGNGAAGRCYLVGAGPGPADYLTMRAVKLIGAADAIVYDDLGCEDALSYARPTAELVYVGKRGGKAESLKQPQIDQIIVDLCSQGKQVVRLKGGCPAVFSRVASEMSALGAAAIPYELVPGVSSALAAPLFAGFPLTHVSQSSSFTVVSGHDVAGTDWAAFRGLPTLVVLMAGRNLGQIARRLVQDAGWAPDTPMAVVRSAGLPEQRTWLTSLGSAEADLAEAGQLSPCIVVVGKVAATGNYA